MLAAISALSATEGIDRERITARYAAVVPRLLEEGMLRSVFVGMVLASAVMLTGETLSTQAAHLVASSTRSAAIAAAAVYAALLLGLGSIPYSILLRAERARLAVDSTITRENALVKQPLLAASLALFSLVPLAAALFRISTSTVNRMESGGAVTIGALLLTELSAAVHRTRSTDPNPPSGAGRPLDRVAAQLVTITTRIQHCAEDPGGIDARHIRSLLMALERVAKDAERFALPRVPWWDGNARREARRDGLRLAAVIRAHKTPLPTATNVEHFTKIAQSLAYGLDAWARDDYTTMIQHAPEMPPPSGLRPLLSRLGPAALLATFGIALPLLPPLSQSAQAASGARTSLLVAAALALTTGAVQAPEYILAALNPVGSSPR